MREHRNETYQDLQEDETELGISQSEEDENRNAESKKIGMLMRIETLSGVEKDVKRGCLFLPALLEGQAAHP